GALMRGGTGGRRTALARVLLGSLVLMVVAAAGVGCFNNPAPKPGGAGAAARSQVPDDDAPMSAMPGMFASPSTSLAPGAITQPGAPLPGMPPLLDPHDVYAADRPGQLSPAVRNDPELVYVPNLGSGTVSVIDPKRYKVIRTVRVGAGPQHVVPSWDLRTLWV